MNGFANRIGVLGLGLFLFPITLFSTGYDLSRMAAFHNLLATLSGLFLLGTAAWLKCSARRLLATKTEKLYRNSVAWRERKYKLHFDRHPSPDNFR